MIELPYPPKEHWQYLVDVAHDTIAGIEPEASRSELSKDRLPEKVASKEVTGKWRRSLLRTPASLEPARDGAKTSLILANAIAENLEATIKAAIEERGLGDVWRQAIEWASTWPASLADLPQEPTPQEDELRRVLVAICAGVRRAANWTADLLARHSQVEDDAWTTWLDGLGLDNHFREAVVDETDNIEEWVALSTSDADVYDTVKALRVTQGFYTTPSRTLDRDRDWDWQRIGVRHRDPYVVVYDGPITQPATLTPVLESLPKEAGKRPALVIIADEVSGEAQEALHTQSDGSFRYLVLPTPSYRHPDRRKYLEDIAKFTGAILLPETEVPLLRLGGGDEEHDESLWLTVTIPSEEEGELQVQPDHLGKKLRLVLSNRQRTLLIRKYGEPDDEQVDQDLQDWPRRSGTALWQVQITSVLPAGPSESISREKWQKAQEARHSGLVAGGGAALVWAQGRLDFDPPEDVADERLPLVEAGWQALRSALDAPLAAIVSKVGIPVDSAQYRQVVDQIQGADAPVVGYWVDKDERPLGFQIGEFSDVRIIKQADPARTTSLLVLHAAAIAPRVLAMRSLGTARA